MSIIVALPVCGQAKSKARLLGPVGEGWCGGHRQVWPYRMYGGKLSFRAEDEPCSADAGSQFGLPSGSSSGLRRNPQQRI
jgi:hypothetical protein